MIMCRPQYRHQRGKAHSPTFLCSLYSKGGR